MVQQQCISSSVCGLIWGKKKENRTSGRKDQGAVKHFLLPTYKRGCDSVREGEGLRIEERQ